MIGHVEWFWCYLGFIRGITPHFWLHAPDFVDLGGTIRAVAIDIMYAVGIFLYYVLAGRTEWLSLCCCWFLGDLSCKIFAEPCPCLSGLSLFYHASNVVIEGPEAGLSSSVIVKPSSIPVFNGSTAARKMERPNGASFMGCPDLVADTGHVPASFFARCIYWT